MIFINKYGNDNIKNIIVSIIEKQIKKNYYFNSKRQISLVLTIPNL
jgi:hypothetical protein